MQTTTTTQFRPRPPSPRARLVRWTTRHTIRPLEHLVPQGELGVKITRRLLATMMAGAGSTPRGLDVVPVDSTTQGFGRVKGEWVRPEAPRSGNVILYLHGSGYTLCSVKTHRSLVSRLAEATNVAIFSTEYRLAPKHPFPAAPDDVRRAYDWLIGQGWQASEIVVAGDSAGGHLTLDLALQLLREGRELPAGLVMFSPLADLSCTLMAQREGAIPDPMISTAAVRRLFAHYLAGTDPLHPRLTHVLEQGEMLPPTLIQAGGAEFLAADAHHIADLLAATGTDVRLEVWPGQMHVFQAADRIVPEADRALRRAARFIVTALETSALATTKEATA